MRSHKLSSKRERAENRVAETLLTIRCLAHLQICYRMMISRWWSNRTELFWCCCCFSDARNVNLMNLLMPLAGKTLQLIAVNLKLLLINLNKPQKSDASKQGSGRVQWADGERKADELMWFCPCLESMLLLLLLLMLLFSSRVLLLISLNLFPIVARIFKVSLLTSSHHLSFIQLFKQVLASLTTHISLST